MNFYPVKINRGNSSLDCENCPYFDGVEICTVAMKRVEDVICPVELTTDIFEE
jgi:hypothetical protein